MKILKEKKIMCLFCKSETKIIHNYECYPIYECPNCGNYIIPHSIIMDLYSNRIKFNLKDYRKKTNEYGLIFIGTRKNYDEYNSKVFSKYNLETDSTFVDITQL